MQYRTEIVVAADRYVCLQLPDFIPVGQATVTVLVNEPTAPPPEPPDDGRSGVDDIEWWEEFDADAAGDAR